jgi:uncharacterized protein YgiM (DUF1202 family)
MTKTTTMIFLLALLGSFNVAHSEEQLRDKQFQRVIVADPYIDVHTGHGKGYPIFHVIERGEAIEIILRHTSWFKIKNEAGIEGWISLEQMTLTLAPGSNEQIEFETFTHEDFVERHWELGVLGGRFSHAETITIYGNYLFNKSLAAELSYAEVVGNSSSSNLYKLGIVMQPFPTFTYSPYISMGTGQIKTKPKTTLVLPDDKSNHFSNIGLGIRTYLSKRIILRLEYSNYIIFSASNTNDRNEDIKEWKTGFAVFF